MALVEGTIAIQDELKGELLILHMRGKLDALSAPSSEKRIFEYINEGHYHMILDFAGITYLSSAGLRMLLSTTKRLKTFSGGIVLCAVQGNVMDVLKMSGFDRVLELAPNLEEALKKFDVAVSMPYKSSE